MTKDFRTTPTFRLGNALATAVLRRGVPLGAMALLTVPGRTSGEPRTTTVTLLIRDGQRWLRSPCGAVHWVRNLRATGQATLTRGRHTAAVSAVALSPAAAAPVLKWALASIPSLLRGSYDVTPDSPREAFAREAPRHPTFRILATSPTQQ